MDFFDALLLIALVANPLVADRVAWAMDVPSHSRMTASAVGFVLGIVGFFAFGLFSTLQCTSDTQPEHVDPICGDGPRDVTLTVIGAVGVPLVAAAVPVALAAAAWSRGHVPWALVAAGVALVGCSLAPAWFLVLVT